MVEINIAAISTKDSVKQMQSYFGGDISEEWGEHTLSFNGNLGKGSIKFLTFDWGVSLLEFNAIFSDDLMFINSTANFNPIHFSFVSKGSFSHKFSNERDFSVVDQYHSCIVVSTKALDHLTVIPKNVPILFNNIRVVRKEYLKKRLNNVEQLNQKLYDVFVNRLDGETFSYYSPMHLKMEDHVNAIRNKKTSGITRILKIEGEVFHLLSMHIARHDRNQNHKEIPHSLSKSELKTIKKLSKRIVQNPALDYSLNELSKSSGLSQAKLQEGFKFIYTRTVTEYIRHIRLEASRELMNTTDLNISQIVYTIGFTSRSYFSKIFREKFDVTPNEYKKQIVQTTENIVS